VVISADVAARLISLDLSNASSTFSSASRSIGVHESKRKYPLFSIINALLIKLSELGA
jgi:hypothetical protein